MTQEERIFLKEACTSSLTVSSWRIRGLASKLHPILRLPVGRTEGNEQIPDPPFHVGDTFYVAERWAYRDPADIGSGILYKADYQGKELRRQVLRIHWQPATRMVKEYARLFFRVKEIRLERLLSANTDDLLNEGSPACILTTNMAEKRCYGDCQHCNDACSVKQQYRTLWDHEAASKNSALYEEDPLTWVLSLERI